MGGRFASSFALTFVGCVAAGESFDLPNDEAAYFVATIENESVHVRALRTSPSRDGFALRPELEAYLLEVSKDRLRAFAPSIDLERVHEIEPTLSGELAAECGELGQLVRLDAGDGSRLDIAAPTVGTLSRLEWGVAGATLVPIASWPDLLTTWVLRTPIASPCASRNVAVEPFLANSPFVDFGERLGPDTIEPSSPQVANIHHVEYVDEDAALLLTSRALVLGRRGHSLSEALMIDENSSSFPPRLDEGQYWRFIDFSLGELIAGRREGYLLAHLIQREPSEFVGAAIIQFTITSTGVFAFTRRHIQFAGVDDAEADALREIVVRPDGGFAAVGAAIIAMGAREGEVRIGQRSGMNGTFILFPPPPFPTAVVQDRTSSWWVGDLEFAESLHREPGSRSIAEVEGVTRLVASPQGLNLVSANAQPELFRREGPDDWRPHPWWLPAAASRCTSDTTRCGRLQPQPSAGIRDFVDPEGSGAILHAFDECPFVFWTVPLENRCSDAMALEWSNYVLPGGGRDEVTSIARSGRRILVAGTIGLLLELTLD